MTFSELSHRITFSHQSHHKRMCIPKPKHSEGPKSITMERPPDWKHRLEQINRLRDQHWANSGWHQPRNHLWSRDFCLRGQSVQHQPRPVLQTGSFPGRGWQASSGLLPRSGTWLGIQVLHCCDHTKTAVPVCGKAGRGIRAAGIQLHLFPEPGSPTQLPGVSR